MQMQHAATRNITLLQTRDSVWQQKTLPDLDYADTTKHGWPLEQRKKKVDETVPSRERPEDTRVTELEKEIRKMGNQIELKRIGVNSTAGRGSEIVSCSTCTRPTCSSMQEKGG